MSKYVFVLTCLLLVCLPLAGPFAHAQRAKVWQVGVIYHGREWNAAIEGLRGGIKELGLEEGKQLVLQIRDTKGDSNAVDEAARNFERQRIDLLYSVATSVTIRVKKATADIPIVFCAGTDPVALGLVDSFAKPGGRLTGVHFLATDLTGKRLEILKDIVPKLHRVLTFYDPANPVAREAGRLAREASRLLRVELLEHHVGSVQEFQARLHALKTKEADGF